MKRAGLSLVVWFAHSTKRRITQPVEPLRCLLIRCKIDITEQHTRTDYARSRDGLERDHAVPCSGAPSGEDQEAEKGAEQGRRDAAERVQVSVSPVECSGPDADRRSGPQERSPFNVDGAVHVAREKPAHGDDAVERGV